MGVSVVSHHTLSGRKPSESWQFLTTAGFPSPCERQRAPLAWGGGWAWASEASRFLLTVKPVRQFAKHRLPGSRVCLDPVSPGGAVSTPSDRR